MDITFFPTSEVPLPPDQVRFRSVKVAGYPDGRRVGVLVELTPFQVRPNVDITLLAPGGDVVALANIVEASEPQMSVTLHIRGNPPAGVFTARLTLGYPDKAPADQANLEFDLSAEEADQAE